MPLKTETNTPEMEERVFEAFSCHDASAQLNLDIDSEDQDIYDAVFEHGQWWISASTGAQWSVVDATGGTSVDGFDFEQVTEAE